MINLAIVIPAYKAKYFHKTLQSLARQTNKDFNLYIGDDCSPDDLKSIADSFSDQLNITYTKFPANIGPQNLVKQWRRCVDLVNRQEKWLWLFSDDDIADDTCVESFYLTLQNKKDRFEVFRFNTVTIDENGDIIRKNATGPEEESSEEMAFHLLNAERGNSMPDHIFSRSVYDRCGGFVDTDFAQGADWATSILFSKQKGICIINGALVHWRYSGNNISSMAHTQKNDTIKGYLQFIAWAVDHFQYLKTGNTGVDFSMILSALKNNLTNIIIYHYKGYNVKFAPTLYKFYRETLQLSASKAVKELIKVKEATVPLLHKLSDLSIRLNDAILRRVFKQQSANNKPYENYK